jgi:hypothetical protein
MKNLVFILLIFSFSANAQNKTVILKIPTVANPITGTGTTNYLPKFTGTSSIGNSAITDNGTTVSLISRVLSGTSASFSNNVEIAGSTGTNLTYSLSPNGWNSAKHRLTVPTSGNTSMWSWNWNGTARDYASYGSSNIQITDNVITFSNGTGNPSEVARFNGTSLLVGTSTDAGYKLDINGTGRFSGALTGTSATFSTSVTAQQFASTVQTLTDGATITFNGNNGSNAVVTLGGNRTLAWSNTVAGTYYTLRVIQDATGSRTLTLPSGSKVIGGGAGAITLSTAAASVDLITFYYDGTNYYVTYGTNYN